MKTWLLLILICLYNYSALKSQENSLGIQSFEKSIKVELDSMAQLTSDSAKIEMMDIIQSELSEVLKNPASFIFAFDSLKNIGKITSPDNTFRLFSWNIYLNNNTYRNFAIVQIKPEKDQNCKVIKFIDNTEIDEAANKKILPETWYGALYYKIIPVKINGNTFYTLLGLDSFSPYVSKKVIDVLRFEKEGLFLGAPIFEKSGKLMSRMVFSFSSRITMMLNYDEKLKTIVFDHLSPSDSRYTGQYEFYGPDFSFDGLLLSKNKWLFVDDVKPNRPKRK